MSVKLITSKSKRPMPWLESRDWPECYRVRLADKGLSSQKSQWCKQSCVREEWAMNFGGEVFYFLRLEDATAFRLRWEGVK
jgi:hypothetical protein